MKDYFKRNYKLFLFTFLTLLYLELLLRIQTVSNFDGFTIFSILFLVPIAFCISAIIRLSNKIFNVDSVLVFGFITAFYIINLIYFKTFGSYFSISMIGAGANAVKGFYWSMITTVKENIITIILLLLPVVYLVLDTFLLKRINTVPKFIHRPINLLLGVLSWILVVCLLPLSGSEDFSAYGVYHSPFVDTDTASSKLGVITNALIESKYALFGKPEGNLIDVVEAEEEEEIEEVVIEYNRNDFIDFNELLQLDNSKAINNVLEYLKTVPNTRKNEYSSMFEGYNLIYICAESFSRMAVDPIVTPTLYKLANNGFVLKNYYNCFRNVTTNGEYAFLTGLWPDVAREETNQGRISGTMGQSIEKDMSYALGNMFNTTGIQSKGYHNYYGYYYGRNQTLPNMGFDCKFMNDGMSFSSYWPASDLEMMQQSIPDYIQDDRFLAYYMTFSGHGNYTTGNNIVYKNYDTVKQLLGDRVVSENAIGYLAANYELELAMNYLLQELENAGKLDNTVIVLTGDHYPYYLSDEAYGYLKNSDVVDEFEPYRSTCIIYNSAMSKTVVDTPCCNVDILPTILNLFGIDYDSRLYAGTDIFSTGTHVAMLYNKSFISEYCKYNALNGKVIWLKEYTDDEDANQSYVDGLYSYVKNKYAYSISVENTDFYHYLNSNINH